MPRWKQKKLKNLCNPKSEHNQTNTDDGQANYVVRVFLQQLNEYHYAFRVCIFDIPIILPILHDSFT